jgi:hypothetical protein
MRYFIGLVCVLALGVVGCGETTGTGGMAASVNDPAPNRVQPGEYGCPGCPDTDETDFEQELGNETAKTFAGKVSGADGNGAIYVANDEGQEFFGTIPTDEATGDYSVEIPLFCGRQLVKCVWSNEVGDYVLVIEVTTSDCVEPDIRLTLSWDGLGRDWELHLIKPGGRINDDATDCTWTSCIGGSPDWGVAGDPGDDPQKDVDNVGSFGPENIFLARPESGTYTVMVEHWSASGDPESDGQVAINVRGKPSVIVVKENLAPFFVWTAATIEWPGGVVTPRQDVFDCTDGWSDGCTVEIP